ncbi:hypothetical protein [Actinomadura macra]|uniref:hypothetical protein n=1 Tax=Actinomadura macra TaxID=46164 RepID=UPI00083473E5|nr:hypothetical protein [Actinomadura macra]
MNDRETTTDEDIERLAGELHENVRRLNHVTQGPLGLTQPAAAYTVLGNLAQTAFRLVQTAEQLDCFLTEQLDAGRLGHDEGHDPVTTVTKAHAALARATEQAADLGETFRRAAGAVASIHALDPEEQPSLDRSPLADVNSQEDAQVESAAEGFPKPIDDVLGDSAPVEQSPAPPRSSPPIPHPRRER